MIEHFLVPENAPEAVADMCGISAKRIRTLAAELAHVAFDQEIRLPRKWTDFRGMTYDEMIGRPVDPCHARDFGPWQRVSNLPRAAHIADHFGVG
jgi:hypothetical protein